jgi:hypothetical protein
MAGGRAGVADVRGPRLLMFFVMPALVAGMGERERRRSSDGYARP